METTNEDKLRSLVAGFMQHERVDVDAALHIVKRVAQALGFTSVDDLLVVLDTIEQETVAVSGEFQGEGMRARRVLRALYDTFVVSLTPAGHAAARAILTRTEGIWTTPARGH